LAHGLFSFPAKLLVDTRQWLILYRRLAIATKRLKFTCFGDAAFSGKRYRFLITNRKPVLPT
jgi:hypothetical protein